MGQAEGVLAGVKDGGQVGCVEGGSMIFCIGVLLGYFHGIFLGRVNGCELESSIEVPLGYY